MASGPCSCTTTGAQFQSVRSSLIGKTLAAIFGKIEHVELVLLSQLIQRGQNVPGVAEHVERLAVDGEFKARRLHTVDVYAVVDFRAQARLLVRRAGENMDLMAKARQSAGLDPSLRAHAAPRGLRRILLRYQADYHGRVSDWVARSELQAKGVFADLPRPSLDAQDVPPWLPKRVI